MSRFARLITRYLGSDFTSVTPLIAYAIIEVMKSLSESSKGFTFIEVILFLAISGTMITIAMLSIRGRTREVQFSDAVQATEAFLDRRLSQITDGSIIADTEDCRWNGSSYVAGPSDGSCVFLGYMYDFDPSNTTEIGIIQIYGARLPSDDPCFAANPTDPLYCVHPKPAPVTSNTPTIVDSFQIPWGVRVRNTWAYGNATRYMGFLRDPRGRTLIPVSFRPGYEAELDNRDAYTHAYAGTQVGGEFSAVICVVNDYGRQATYNLGRHEDQFAIKTQIDSQFTRNWCSRSII